MKSVRLEWVLGNVRQAKDLLKDALSKYDDFPKVTVNNKMLQETTTFFLFFFSLA